MNTRMEFNRLLASFDFAGSRRDHGWKHWREQCRDEALKAFANLNLPLKVPIKVVFEIKMVDVRDIKDYDLDNLVKPLIDALGAAGLFKKSRIGPNTQWNTEDYWVYRIEATKILKSDNPSTHVEVWVEDT